MATRVGGSELDVVSHELRAPLASIKLAARALEQEQLDDVRRRRLVRMIVHESERLGRLLDDLRAAGAPLVSLVPLDPAAAAYDVAETAALTVPEGVSVRVDAPSGLPEVAADPDRLRQVLVNLLENAGRHSPAGGEIVLAVESAPGAVRFSVADRGPGVPAVEREHIFERAYGLHPGGSGLGLHIARQLVARMGGEIWVESREPGPGARFVFALPAL